MTFWDSASDEDPEERAAEYADEDDCGR